MRCAGDSVVDLDLHKGERDRCACACVHVLRGRACSDPPRGTLSVLWLPIEGLHEAGLARRVDVQGSCPVARAASLADAAQRRSVPESCRSRAAADVSWRRPRDTMHLARSSSTEANPTSVFVASASTTVKVCVAQRTAADPQRVRKQHNSIRVLSQWKLRSSLQSLHCALLFSSKTPWCGLVCNSHRATSAKAPAVHYLKVETPASCPRCCSACVTRSCGIDFRQRADARADWCLVLHACWLTRLLVPMRPARLFPWTSGRVCSRSWAFSSATCTTQTNSGPD